MKRPCPVRCVCVFLVLILLRPCWSAAQENPAAGPDISTLVGSDDLHAAALRSNVKRVRQLLASGADARATNAAGATPLHYGAGNPRIVELLLRSGADPNALSIAGTTPLHVAATKRDGGASVRQLLGAGARVDAARAQPPFGE